jgi:hypothetical protein
MASSSLECLGLAPPDENLSDLLAAVEPHIELVGRRGGVHLLRYEDPTGGRLTMAFTDESGVIELIPSYAPAPVVDLRRLGALRDEVVIASLDEDGVEVGRLALDLVQWRDLPGHPVDRQVRVTAFGHAVQQYADDAAYVASLPPGGIPYGAESFVPLGLFGTGDERPSARAQLNGTVLETTTRTSRLTGQTFHACRVRSAGFEAAVLLSDTEHPAPPRPGSVLAGLVMLVGEVEGDDPAPSPLRRLLGLRR